MVRAATGYVEGDRGRVVHWLLFGTMSFAPRMPDAPMGMHPEKKARPGEHDAPVVLLGPVDARDRHEKPDLARDYHIGSFADPVSCVRFRLGIHKRLSRRMVALHATQTCDGIAGWADRLSGDRLISVATGCAKCFIPRINLLERINRRMRRTLQLCAAGSGMHAVYEPLDVAGSVNAILETDDVSQLVSQYVGPDPGHIAAEQWNYMAEGFQPEEGINEIIEASGPGIERARVLLQKGSDLTVDYTLFHSVLRAVSIMCDGVRARPFVGWHPTGGQALVVWPDSEETRAAQHTPPYHVRELATRADPRDEEDGPIVSTAAVWDRSLTAIDTPAPLVEGLVSFTFLDSTSALDLGTHRLINIYVRRDCALLHRLSSDEIRVLVADPGLPGPDFD